jgi:phosphoglycerol transferase MdoB-like AlkP superfamily enzyme
MQFATIYNLRKTSRAFFFVFTLGYLITYLLAANGIMESITAPLAIYLDLPAILTAILFITSGVLKKVDLEETGHHFVTLAIWILAFGVMAVFVLLDLLGRV